MKILGSLDRRDRNLLLGFGVFAVLLIALLAIFSPSTNENDPTPSSYSTTTHGAEAAYLMLGQSGYTVHRWEQPLAALAEQADEHTTLIIAQPYFAHTSESKGPVKQILERGGLVLVTGLAGGLLLPENTVMPNDSDLGAECEAEPRGFQALANSGHVLLRPEATWMESNPRHWVAYTCSDHAVVVTYRFGKGKVVWWASSLPLENAGIQRADNLALLLNSIGPPGERTIYWDESLHGDVRSLWSYAQGTPVHLLWWQLGLISILLLFSYSRRNGPLRPDPVVTRATPIEFVQSLGALYQKANATHAAVSIAYQRFRLFLETTLSIPRASFASAIQVSSALAREFGGRSEKLKEDLVACENAAVAEQLTAKQALYLVRALREHEEFLRTKLHSDVKDDRLGRNAS